MTNVQIIDALKAGLVASGKIQAGEEIHTYRHWRSLGYQVFRGEKAVASANIWQHFKKSGKAEEAGDDEGQEKAPQGQMRLKRAYFFSTKQVFELDGGD